MAETGSRNPGGEPGAEVSQELITIERDGPVATLRMNLSGHTKPPYSLRSEVWDSLYPIFGQLSKERETRVVVLRGARPRFGAGADFHELLEILEEDRKNGDDRAAQENWAKVNRTHEAIEQCPKPVIAVLERWALGAAFALALACDFRIAEEGTLVGVPAPSKGLTLGIVDAQRLVSLVGKGRAKEVLMLGKMYDAKEALDLGLVTSVAPKGKVDETLKGMTDILLGNAPLAVAEAKKNVELASKNPGLSGITPTSERILWANSYDLDEGINAFLERRDPKFEGR